MSRKNPYHAEIDSYGNKFWFFNNKCHRVNGPAVEWRSCLGGFNQPVAIQEHEQSDSFQIQKDRLADASQLSGLIAHWQSALEAIGFLDPKAPKKLMPRLNQLFNRAQMTEEEIHIFRGIARNIIQLSQREEKSEQATKTANQTSDSKKDRL